MDDYFFCKSINSVGWENTLLQLEICTRPVHVTYRNINVGALCFDFRQKTQKCELRAPVDATVASRMVSLGITGS
jgi:hypothetical protein